MVDSSRKVVLVVSLVAVLFFLAGNFVATRLDMKSPFRPLSIFGEVVSHVTKDYVEDVDADRAMKGAIAGFLEGLDPMCSYLDKDEVAQYERIRRLAEESDIAITKRFGYVLVMSVEPGSSAESAGLKQGDYIRAVNHESTRDMGLFQAQAALAGKPPIVLTIVRDSWRAGPASVNLTVTAPPRRPPANLSTRDGLTILTLHRVRGGAADSLRSAVARSQAPDVPAAARNRLVVDLRGCTGTDYEEALRVLSTIAVEGEIATRRDRSGRPNVYRSDVSQHAGSPTCVVLIDEYTMGAAELIAASLKHKGLARLFGKKSYGAVREQTLRLFPDGSGVLLSTYEWTAADHAVITDRGVEPDVLQQESVKDAGKDPALEAAVAYLLKA